MKRLENIKGQIVEMPEIAKRYTVCFFASYGWNMGAQLFSTPEEAVYDFLKYPTECIYYTVIEVTLPIPKL